MKVSFGVRSTRCLTRSTSPRTGSASGWWRSSPAVTTTRPPQTHSPSQSQKHIRPSCQGCSRDVLHNLAGLDHARGRYAEAEPVARRGLEIRHRSGDSGGVAADAAALAAILEALGRGEE